MLVPVEQGLPEVARRLRAMVVWMHEDPLVVGRTYIAKHTTRTVRATVKAIRYRVDIGSLEQATAASVAMNEIAEVELETSQPLFFDAYVESRTTGSLILIDGVSNATVGAAMIVGAAQSADGDRSRTTLVFVPERPELAERLREALELRLQRVAVIDDALIPDDALVAVVRALEIAGVTAITARPLSAERIAEVIRAVEGFAVGAVVVGEGLDDDEVLRLAGVEA
jgi:bifunctional enzyme CysN/CysC/sulfate adenylyltransferase subunit 1